MITNLLHRTQEVHGDQILYRFGNGLVVRTERLAAKTPLRILGSGGAAEYVAELHVEFF